MSHDIRAELIHLPTIVSLTRGDIFGSVAIFNWIFITKALHCDAMFANIAHLSPSVNLLNSSATGNPPPPSSARNKYETNAPNGSLK